jgi:hypothetical protein
MFKRYKTTDDELSDAGISFQKLKERRHGEVAPKPVDNTTTAPEVPTVSRDKIGAKAMARDMTGIDEADIPLFKKMGNDSFDKLKPIYIAQKTAIQEKQQLQQQIDEFQKVGVPKSYYQHPQAYTLSPKYNDLASRTRSAQAIQQHWAEQMARIRRGEEFVDLVEDGKGGIVRAQPRPATAEDEANVIGYLTGAQTQYINAQTQLRQFEDGWTQSHQRDVQFLKSVEDQYFPGYNDDKHPTKAVQKSILESLPESQRDNVLAPLLSKTGATNVLLQNKVKELTTELNQLKARLGLQGKQQPRPGVAANGSAGGKSVSFQALRNRGNR